MLARINSIIRAGTRLFVKSPKLYIDVPANRPINWSISKSHERVLEHELNLRKVKFICNNLSNLCKGDLFEVDIGDEDHVVFYLRTGIKVFEETPEIASYRALRSYL